MWSGGKEVEFEATKNCHHLLFSSFQKFPLNGGDERGEYKFGMRFLEMKWKYETFSNDLWFSLYRNEMMDEHGTKKKSFSSTRSLGYLRSSSLCNIHLRVAIKCLVSEWGRGKKDTEIFFETDDDVNGWHRYEAKGKSNVECRRCGPSSHESRNSLLVDSVCLANFHCRRHSLCLTVRTKNWKFHKFPFQFLPTSTTESEISFPSSTMKLRNEKDYFFCCFILLPFSYQNKSCNCFEIFLCAMCAACFLFLFNFFEASLNKRIRGWGLQFGPDRCWKF